MLVSASLEGIASHNLRNSFVQFLFMMVPLDVTYSIIVSFVFSKRLNKQ